MLERLSISFKVNQTLANDKDEYKKFFDEEFQKYYQRLSEEFPIDIDVRTEVNRRFKDFEVRLESNEEKVSQTAAYIYSNIFSEEKSRIKFRLL